MMNLKIIFFSFLLSSLASKSEQQASPFEFQSQQSNLTQSLFANYANKIRPENIVNGDLAIIIEQIADVNTDNQLVISSLKIRAQWIDKRLAWASEQFFNITQVYLEANKLWQPDFLVQNSFETDNYLSNYNPVQLASVDFNGNVRINYARPFLRTKCSFHVRKFPWVKQTCVISITASGLNFTLNTGNVSKENLIENPLWALDRVDAVSTQRDLNYSVDINLYLNRRPFYFMISNIFPYIILNVLTLLSYGLASKSQFVTSKLFKALFHIQIHDSIRK
jgi:hypothetical protein